jgi:succinate---hydroxymethylglutarate CoA-transferase
MSLYYASINRNKRSMTLNLKHPTALGIVKELAKQADVLVHNFLPSAIAKLGLTWEEMHALNPRLVYASISGYGATGPKAARAGYDAIALAEAGLLHITGNKDSGPTKPGVAIGDLCTGLYVHGAILAGLRQRDVEGKGCKIDGSLFETGLTLLINVGLASLNLDLDKGPERRRKGGRFGLGHAALVPYGGFKTKDGRMIFVAANNNRQWRKLCEVLAIWDEVRGVERFGSNDGRVENREEVDGLVGKRLMEKTSKEWLEVFEGTGLPYGAINNVVEALEDEQSHARDMVMEIKDFEAAKDGVLRTIGPAVKFDSAKMGLRRKPPTLGEHTDEILSDLGYDSVAVEQLRRDKVV